MLWLKGRRLRELRYGWNDFRRHASLVLVGDQSLGQTRFMKVSDLEKKVC